MIKKYATLFFIFCGPLNARDYLRDGARVAIRR